MTLFRPAVIEAQRRRVYGSVTLHQPARLAAFSAVAVISVAIGTAYLALGQYARKETVAGWIAPEAGLSAAYAPRGGVADAVLVRQGDMVAVGSGDHGKASETTLSRFCLQDHWQLVGVEQAGQPRTAIVLGWPIQNFRLPNLRYHVLLPKIVIHRMLANSLFRYLKYPTLLRQLQRRP